jgi:hypothetical protein
MESSCDLLCSPKREFDLGGRRLLCLLHERAYHDHPAADRRDAERAGYSVAACQPQLPQLPLQVFYVRPAQAFQPRSADTVGKPKEPRLHVRRKRGDLRGDNLVQDFDAPKHPRLYLIFEINVRADAPQIRPLPRTLVTPARRTAFHHSATEKQ